MSKRTIVIGDLHGCYEEALDLLDKLAVSSSDRVIFAGDLVDRGPEPWHCVELAMENECVLGNHEEKHLKYRRRGTPRSQMTEAHAYTAWGLSDRHLDYFEKLPLYIKLPEYNAVVVHAGVLPGLSIEQQDPGTLLHCQSICPPDTKSYWPSKAPAGYQFWTNFYKGPERVIFGHSVLSKPLLTDYVCGVDTGCVFGHELTAVVLPNWDIVQVPARKRWHESARSKEIARFHVQEDVYCYS